MKKGLSASFKRQIPLYLMMLPPFLLVLIYSYGPMFGLVMAFQDFEPTLGFFGSEWVGLDNFERLMQIPDIWGVVRNTFFIATMKILMGMICAIIVAILLNELGNKVYKRTVQTIIYAPYFLSWVILGGIFREFLARDGLFNLILSQVGIPSVNYLGEAAAFPWVIIITDLWQNTGFNAIVYLAAITNINPTLYEAAAIDGAGRFNQVMKITIPGIMPVVGVTFVLSLAKIFQDDFEQIYALVGGNSELFETAEVIGSWSYRTFRASFKGWGYTQAVGLLQSVMSLILVLVGNHIVRKSGTFSLY